MALSLVIVPAAAAHGSKHHPAPLPTQIDLPDGFQPEGITSGLSSRFGARPSSTSARARTAPSGRAAPRPARARSWSPAGGQAALGLHVDWRGRLWVAGGASQTIRVYNAKTGALLRYLLVPDHRVPERPRHHPLGRLRDRLGQPAARGRAVPALVEASRHKWGKLPATSKAKILALTGEIAYTTGFNANGIVAKSGWLVARPVEHRASSSASTRGRASPRRSTPTATASRTATASSCAAAGCTSCATRTTWSRC